MAWSPEEKKYFRRAAFAYEKITISNVSKAFTAATYAPGAGAATKAIVTVEVTNDIRYRLDGGDPTASDGHLLKSTDQPLVINTPGEIVNFRAIRATGSDGTIQVTYCK